MEKKILTIQDISCVGQCSVTVALPIISACGVETAILPTAILSTHTAGFKGFTCLSMTGEFPKIINHWEKENISFDGVYTGYLMTDQIDYVIEICEKFNKGLKIIDPVMADNGNFYYGFDENFAKEMARLCNGADVILPNLTEAHYLLGKKPVISGYNEEYIENLVKELSKKLNVKCVILTGVSFDDSTLGIACYNAECNDVQYYFNEKIYRNFHGTGDIYSSSFVGALMNGLSTFDSACVAVDYTVEAMKATLNDAEKHGYGVFFESCIPYLLKKIGKNKDE